MTSYESGEKRAGLSFAAVPGKKLSGFYRGNVLAAYNKTGRLSRKRSHPPGRFSFISDVITRSGARKGRELRKGGRGEWDTGSKDSTTREYFPTVDSCIYPLLCSVATYYHRFLNKPAWTNFDGEHWLSLSPFFSPSVRFFSLCSRDGSGRLKWVCVHSPDLFFLFLL